MEGLYLTYTYPDGLGTGGTFTDGDGFDKDTIQTIIDGVVAHTRSEERKRIIKLLENTEATPDGLLVITQLIALIKGENK